MISSPKYLHDLLPLKLGQVEHSRLGQGFSCKNTLMFYILSVHNANNSYS